MSLISDKQIRFSLTSQTDVNSSSLIIDNASSEQSIKKNYKLGSIGFEPCQTCPEKACHGHPAKTKLNIPIFKSAFKKTPGFDKILKLMCPSCYFIKSAQINSFIIDTIEESGTVTAAHKIAFEELYLTHVAKQTKIKCCSENCLVMSSAITYNPSTNGFQYNTNIVVPMTNEQVYALLRSVPLTLRKLLTPMNATDIITPENVFYHEYMNITSNYARQPTEYNGKHHNFLTSQLSSLIVKISNELAPRTIQAEFDNIEYGSNNNAYSTSSRDCLAEQAGFTSKQGLPRTGILRKRVGNTGRGVIEPSSSPIGTVHLAKEFINTLEHHIHYTPITENYINNILKDPKQTIIKSFIRFFPGRSNPYVLNKSHNKRVVQTLRYGDIVCTSLLPGHYVTTSRSPALQKWNLQAVEIAEPTQILEGDKVERVISQNTAVGPSYNADYDGDEMSIKVFNNPAASIELGLVLNTLCNLKHPDTGTTMFGLVQDEIIGANLLCKEKNIPREMAFKIFGKYNRFLLLQDEQKDFYDGDELICMLLEDHFTYPNMFENKKLIVNNITSSMVSANSVNSIFNAISQSYDSNKVIKIIVVLQEIIHNFTRYYGISIKLKDLVPYPPMLEELEAYVKENVQKIDSLIQYAIDEDRKKNIHLTDFNDIITLKIKNIEVLTENVKAKLLDYMKKYYDTPGNMFKLCYDTDFKISTKDLIVLFAFLGQKANKEFPTPKVNGKTSLYGVANDLGIVESGFISRPFILGINYNSYVNVAKQEAFPQVVKMTSQTALAGFLGKRMIKYVSCFYINYNKFVVNDHYIYNFNPNFYKISLGDAVKIKFLLPNNTFVWKSEIQDIFEKKFRSIITQIQSKDFIIIDNIIFFLNLHSLMAMYYYNVTANKKNIIPPNHNKNKSDIYNFTRYITERFYFNLNDTSIILYVLLTYFDPSGFAFKDNIPTMKNYLTTELLEDIFRKIEFKLIYSMSPGFNFGYQIAHTIQEINTQKTLSSFHDKTKGGAAIDNTSIDIFKNLIELANTNLSNGRGDIAVCIAEDRDIIEKIKTEFEYICLKSLKESSNISSVLKLENKHFIVYKNVFNISLLRQKGIDIVLLYKMFKAYCDSSVTIREYFIDFEIKEADNVNKQGIVILYLGVYSKHVFKNTELREEHIDPHFGISLLFGVHKGKNVNSNLFIETVNMETLTHDYKIVKKKLYKLAFYVESLSDFKNIDTGKLYRIYLPQLLTYQAGGIHSMRNNVNGKVNLIINDQNFESVLRHFFDLRISGAAPTTIKALPDKSQIIKMVHHGNGNMLQQSAFTNSVDNGSDMYFCLLANTIPKFGSNFDKFVIDPNMFDRFEKEESELKELKDEEQIISIF